MNDDDNEIELPEDIEDALEDFEDATRCAEGCKDDEAEEECELARTRLRRAIAEALEDAEG